MNPYIDALMGPSWLNVGHDNIVTYYFADDFDYAWTESEKVLFDKVFAAYEAVCNISFVEVADRSEAEIVENKVTTDLARVLRMPELPWQAWHDEPGDGERSGFYDFQTGGIGEWAIPHEIGHALGLEHPHSTWHGSGLFPGVPVNVSWDLGDHNLNTMISSVMSYNGVGEVAAHAPMALDIATLQQMYGANMATGSGQDTYYINNGFYSCIWDAGGIDTVVGTPGHDVIDLRPATLLNTLDGGGSLSYRASGGWSGGFTIAANVIIENASGGSGNDRIVGNAAANYLLGSSGNDVLYGNAGADVFVGGGGYDAIWLGSDVAQDICIAGTGDTIHQFDNGEDKIDISRFDVDWFKINSKGGQWVLVADYDTDPAADLTIFVVGQRPFLSDIIT